MSRRGSMLVEAAQKETLKGYEEFRLRHDTGWGILLCRAAGEAPSSPARGGARRRTCGGHPL